MHVLIIEDRPEFSDRWSRFLYHYKHSVAVATSHTEALEAFSVKRPDLVICDNDINPCAIHDDIFDGGFFFISQIRTLGFGARIIFYTRNSRQYFEEELDITPLNVRFIQKRLKRQSK